VWVKIKGYPIWPGQVYDLKDVKNEDVVKKKRKNATLIKFIENDTYSWANHADIIPLEKETFENFIISSNHKNFKQWKEALKQCCAGAGIGESVVEQALNDSKGTPKKKKSTSKSPTRKTKRKRDENDDEEKPPKKKEKNEQIYFSRS